MDSCGRQNIGYGVRQGRREVERRARWEK